MGRHYFFYSNKINIKNFGGLPGGGKINIKKCPSDFP